MNPMLTQFFGNYLLEKHIINSDQLLSALRHKRSTHKKIGSMAVAAGYMTPEEVEDVHNMQTYTDGKFAELAVHMGYLTVSQADELIQAQQLGYLLLADSIIELNYCTPEVIAEAVADYEFDYQLSFTSVLVSDKDKAEEMVQHYYHFPETDVANPAKEYTSLLIKNLIRFIGSDFRLSGKIEKLPYLPDMQIISQNFTGDLNIQTALIGYQDFLIQFASRYAGEGFQNEDEYVDASLQDFLNLHNGIFSVNISNEYNIELDLQPTILERYHPSDEDISSVSTCYILPIEFTFGILYFRFIQTDL